MVGQEEVISCLDGYHHQMAAAAAPKPVTVGQQLPLDNQLEVNDPVLLGSLMWLLKKAMDGKIFGIEESSSEFDTDTDDGNSATSRNRGRTGYLTTSLRSHCRRPCCQQRRRTFSTNLSSHTEEEDDNAEEKAPIGVENESTVGMAVSKQDFRRGSNDETVNLSMRIEV